MAREPHHTINGIPVVAVCKRCGREFLSLPQDGIDHWGVLRYRDSPAVECGGVVEPVVAADRPGDVPCGSDLIPDGNRGSAETESRRHPHDTTSDLLRKGET